MTEESTVTSADGADTADAPRDEFDVRALPGGLAGAIEAIVMVVEEPVTATQLASALEVPEPEVLGVLHDLRSHYDQGERGFTLSEVDGGWRVYARHELAPAVEKFLTDGAQARLTKAALETLAVIAYRQPVSRARVGAVRGVNVDGVVRTLLTRGLITEVGLDSEHGAVLYGTTTFFLQRLGISSLDELPALAPYLPDVEELAEMGEPGAALAAMVPTGQPETIATDEPSEFHGQATSGHDEVGNDTGNAVDIDDTEESDDVRDDEPNTIHARDAREAGSEQA